MVASDPKADRCLDWYRPLLRDPRAAYWRDAVHDGGMLTITVYGVGTSGAIATMQARCEFDEYGVLKGDWTRVHAERLGWIGRR